MPLLNAFTEFIEDSFSVEDIWELLTPFALALLETLLVVFVGHKLIQFIGKMIRRATEDAKVERGVVSFLESLVKIVLYVVLGVIVCSIVGIPTASLLALVGSGGLTLGLALQGSLQNFAGGVLILVMKPFVVGDYIFVGTLEGKVSHIDICYTKLVTDDNKVVVLPNGVLSNTNLVNATTRGKRRVDIIVPISYDDDIKAAREMLLKIPPTCQKVLKKEHTEVVVYEFGESSINLSFRCYCRPSDYLTLKYELLEKVKYGIDEGGFTIPFKQVDIHLDGEPGTEPVPDAGKKKERRKSIEDYVIEERL